MIMAVYNVLNVLGVPISFLKRPKLDKDKTVVSYHFFNQGDTEFGDGKPNDHSGALQVDVFSKTDYTSTVSEIKALLKGVGFLYFNGDDNIENLSPNEQIYHKILRFNYIEGEVIR